MHILLEYLFCKNLITCITLDTLYSTGCIQKVLHDINHDVQVSGVTEHLSNFLVSLSDAVSALDDFLEGILIYFSF